MIRKFAWTAVLTIAANNAFAQDLTCRGVGLSAPPPSGYIISLDLVRRDGTWKALHGRIGPSGSTQQTSLAQRGDSLIVRFDEMQATYSGAINNPTGPIRGAWSKGEAKLPLTVRCKPDAPSPDNAHHTVRLVAVEKDVKVEVLDFGGVGRPMLLVHGLNVTAHDFDAFAEKLSAEFHVYALTRRGVGRSSAPDTGYSINRLGDDVVAVADSLKLEKPILVGHSIGGAALSNVGERYPQRIAALIYIDAAYPYAYIDPARDTLKISEEDRPRCPCSIVEQTEFEDPHHVHQLSVPVLAIYATKADWNSRSYDDRQPDWTPAAQAKEFERGISTSHVVRIPNAPHDVFRSHEAQVIGEVRAFIATLPTEKK